MPMARSRSNGLSNVRRNRGISLFHVPLFARNTPNVSSCAIKARVDGSAMAIRGIVQNSLESLRIRTNSAVVIPVSSEPITIRLYGIWVRTGKACSALGNPCTIQPRLRRNCTAERRSSSSGSMTKAIFRLTRFMLVPRASSGRSVPSVERPPAFVYGDQQRIFTVKFPLLVCLPCIGCDDTSPQVMQC